MSDKEENVMIMESDTGKHLLNVICLLITVLMKGKAIDLDNVNFKGSFNKVKEFVTKE